MLPALMGLQALGGSGSGAGGIPGASSSSSATAKAGPITVGGLTFAPKGNPDTMVIAVAVAVLGLGLFALAKRG